MNIAIIILSLVILITLHELGHFIFARRYGVKVEEFGIGIPPRVWGKKIGETIYSLNLIPLGGFVRMLGEEERSETKNSFSEKPIWQRAVIIIAGVVSFWILAILIFSVVFFAWGRPTLVEDGLQEEGVFLTVAIKDVEKIDMDLLDKITPGEKITAVEGEEVYAASVLEKEIREGAETVTVQRGEESAEVSLAGKQEEFLETFFIGNYKMQRMGPFESLVQGFQQTVGVSVMQVVGFGNIIGSAISGEGMPAGVQVSGPVGIGNMALDFLERGVADYLEFVAFIASVLAVINILPIPALDGGRLLFLIIEKLKGSPLPQKIEQGVNAAFFLLLISFMIFITFKDLGL